MKWASRASHVGLLLKVAVGFAVLVAISLIAIYCYFYFVWEHEWYHAYYKHEIEFVGKKGKDGRVEYFSVRVESPNAQAICAECELEFHWKGQKYLVRELGLNDLAEMGISAESNTWSPDGVIMGFLGGKDDRHQDYGVEFYFRNGRIYHFYARYSAHNNVACPFMISQSQRQPVSFPIGEEQLQKSFGVPDSVVAVPGH